MTMRVPPNSLDAERAVLGGVLLEASAMDAVADILGSPDVFYSEANARAYEAMVALHARRIPIDHTTLREELVRSGRLAAVGGDEYLFALTDTLPTVANIEAHAKIVREKATVRALIGACHEIAARGYGDYGDATSYLDDAQSRVFTAAAPFRVGEGMQPLDPMAIMQRIEDISTGKSEAMGMPTGLDALDTRMNGLQPGLFYLVAGRPSMGKSALALGMARAVARSGRLALFFSLEMTAAQCDTRYMALASGVPNNAIRFAQLQAGHASRLTRASQEMASVPFMRDDMPGLTVTAMRNRIRQACAKRPRTPLGIVVVDHIGLMRATEKGLSREQQVSECSRAMKEIAKEFSCAVVALSQLNRECEKTADRRPELHHLRDSGSLEQDADDVIFVYRRGYYASRKKAGKLEAPDRHVTCAIEAGDDDGKAELIRAKVREGAVDTVHVLFEGECTRFVDYGHDDYRPDARFRGDDE